MTQLAKQTQDNSLPQISVWDPMVRLLHLTLVVSFFVAYFSQTEGYTLHLASGYVVLSVVLARIAWGFVGGRYARFSSLIYPPAAVKTHLVGIFSPKHQPERHLGHNPLGGIMVMILMLALLTVALSGVALDAAENRAGPLSSFNLFLHTDLIASMHHFSTNLTLFLVVLHVLGVITMSRLQRENLVAAMVSGRKREISS